MTDDDDLQLVGEGNEYKCTQRFEANEQKREKLILMQEFKKNLLPAHHLLVLTYCSICCSLFN